MRGESNSWNERPRMSEPGPGPALSCVPDAIDPAKRPEHFARIERLFRHAVLACTDVVDGYEFVLDVAEFGEVARFVGLERKCCPFLSFGLDLPAGEDRIRLRIHGPPGSRDLIAAELLGRG